MKSMNNISLRLLALGAAICISAETLAYFTQGSPRLTKQQIEQGQKDAAAFKAKAGAQKSAGNKSMAKFANSDNGKGTSKNNPEDTGLEEDQIGFGKGQAHFGEGQAHFGEGQAHFGEGQNHFGEGQNHFGEGQNHFGN